MNISKTIEENHLIIHVTGRLDSYTSPELESFFSDLDWSGYQGVILEMEKLDYISSAGLRVLLNGSKEFKGKTEIFSLCNMQDHIREIFEISGFDTILQIHASLEEALPPKSRKRP